MKKEKVIDGKALFTAICDAIAKRNAEDKRKMDEDIERYHRGGRQDGL
jgi:hypothetical protein